MKEKNRNRSASLELDSRQLKGKQSVRATFKLPEQSIDLLRVTATHLDVKQKSLIDQLVENRQILEKVAGEAQSSVQKNAQRRQKTFVLSRKSLDMLDEISMMYNISRDYLVELSIERLIPFLESEQEKHRCRRDLIQEVEHYVSQGKKLLIKADEMLGKNDRFRTHLEKIIIHCERNYQDMKKFVKDKKTLLY